MLHSTMAAREGSTPLFEYLDVSADPAARNASRLSAGALASSRALHFTDLGWIQTSVDGAFGSVCHVSVSESGFTALTWTYVPESRTDSASVKTLLADGTIVTTEQIAGQSPTAVLGVTRRAADPAHRFRYVGSGARDVASLLLEHEARVAAMATAENPPVAIDLITYVAMRKRWREISDGDDGARYAWFLAGAFVCQHAVTVAALVAVWKLWPIAASRYGVEVAVSTAIAVVTLGWSWGHLARRGCVAALAFLWARLVVHSEAVFGPRSANELVAFYDKVPRGEIPPDAVVERPIEGAGIDARAPRLRTEIAIAVAASLVFPLLGLLLNLRFGPGGAIAAVGLFFAMNGALTLAKGDGIRGFLRQRFVPELVEPPSEQVTALARPLGLLLCVAGALVLLVARGVVLATSSIAPSPHANVAGAWTALTLLLVWRAVRTCKARR